MSQHSIVGTSRLYSIGVMTLSLALAAGAASASQFEATTSLNPVGSGARATGMGGAFIGVADDATAASWNPAGLVQLEKPEVSAVFSYSGRSQSYATSVTRPELSGKTGSIDSSDLNYASVAYPFQFLKRNMIVTLNYQRMYELDKSVNFNFNGGSFYNYKQSGYLSALSPAIAIQLTPNLYFGAAVNIYDDVAGTNSWKANGSQKDIVDMGGGSTSILTSDWKSRFTSSGLNANLGLMYTYKKFTFGVVGKTPYDADINYSTSTVDSEISIDPVLDENGDTVLGADGKVLTQQTGPKVTNSSKKKSISMSMPASYGFGVSYRHSDNLTIAADVYRTMWSDFYVCEDGIRYNPITGLEYNVSKPKDTTQVRIGGEYLITGDKMTIPVRAGFFYDPQPGFKTVDDFFGISAGSGISYGKYAFDLSYQYRWGNRVIGDYVVPGVSTNVEQHTLMTSLIYHF